MSTAPRTMPPTLEVPKKPGWYWAKWKIPSPGTHEGEELTPSDFWEIAEVWANTVDPNSEEPLGVSVTGVRETQWPDQFYWGPNISDSPKEPVT